MEQVVRANGGQRFIALFSLNGSIDKLLLSISQELRVIVGPEYKSTYKYDELCERWLI